MNGRIFRACWWGAGLGMAAAVMSGCRSDKPTADSSLPHRESELSVAAHAAESPANLANLLRELHERCEYATIADYITADRRDSVIAILRAIDEVLESDDLLKAAVAARFGGPRFIAWDMSIMRNNLGVFSGEVRVINQTFHGNRATVTLQEGEHVPLVRAPFVLSEGRWLYEPDMPPRAMAAGLRGLAGALASIREEIERGDTDYAEYLQSFYGRVLPEMERVVFARDVVETHVSTIEDAD